ncbi:YeeE/YedE family protein [bacterium]|nr:YeeE/YedE family protein [bacterium]
MDTLLPLNIAQLIGPVGEIIAIIALGFGFGFVLERAGFGDSRKLAAQFYFHDMTVFKVMFTAIIVAMVLVFLLCALQVMDYERIWVNPTYLWPGLVGGLIFGAGFIIGGYCPGTALVSAATLKLDGLFFLGGVLLGLFAFGELVPKIWQWFLGAGALGRYSLAQWLGVDPGYVALGIVVIAVGCFVLVEYVERMMASRKEVR